MKDYSKKELFRKLSLFLDGALSADESNELEEYLASHPEAREELQELKALQKLLAERQNLKEDSAFWTRLSEQLRHRTAEHEGLLPFPRRFMPAVAALG